MCHNRCRRGNDRTKVQHGERTLLLFDKCRQQNKEQGNDREAYLGYNATNKDNYPQIQKEKGCLSMIPNQRQR